jgi:hypothetical protein
MKFSAISAFLILLILMSCLFFISCEISAPLSSESAPVVVDDDHATTDDDEALDDDDGTKTMLPQL